MYLWLHDKTAQSIKAHIKILQIRHPIKYFDVLLHMPKIHKKWGPQAMVKAVKAMRNKVTGYLKASKVFGIRKRTVERYSKTDKRSEELVKLLIGRKPVILKTN